MNAPASSMFLTVDAGTQSLRACLIDERGTIHFKSQVAFESPQVSKPGYAEYPVAKFWDACVIAVRDVQSQAAHQRIDICALGVTSQRATVIALDSRGEPLRPALLWSDQRRCQPPDTLGLTGIGMRIIGVHDTVRQFQADAEINYLALEEPGVWAKLHKLVFLSGYLNFRLTGDFKDSVACQVGYIPFDYRQQDWAKPSKWHWRALPAIRRRHLPDLVAPGTVLGQLSANAADELGLSKDLPIIACATDKACEVLGSGCTRTDQACLSFGTSATVNVTSPRYLEVERFVPAYPATLPDHYLCEEQIHRGFWLVNWFKEEFASDEISRALQSGVTAESLFDEFLRNTPPGAGGLMAQPYWSPGVRVPGPEARGALIGFNSSHQRAHVYRALVEGLLYSMREGLEKIIRRTQTPISCIRVAGGGSQSDEVLKLAANVLGRSVERAHTYEASSLGAALCCAVAVGRQPSFEAAVATMTRPGAAFQPDKETANLYNGLYNTVYKHMYARLQPLYHALARHEGL